MLAFTITLFAYTVFAIVAPKLESTHQAQLATKSSIVGAFDTRDGFGFATLDSDNNLSVYNSDGGKVNEKPLQTAVTRKGIFGFKSETLTLRAPVKGYGKRVAYMLVDGKTLVDRDIGGAAEGVQYKLEGATGPAFDVDDHHIAYVKNKTQIVILDKANPKKTIATIPVKVTK